ncbi:uncharacterized protein [Drosophila bipectinata]|uniref:uncharacterized protein isoform X2 n=1 Tax=Drosophila bipectinata TaxID=42026 RepID=UPI0038B270F8
MTSIIMDAPMASGVAEAVPVWKKVDWSPEIEQGIYRDWGSYYSRRRRENLGMYYFDKAMQLAPKDYVTLWLRSQSRRRNALPRLALSDSLEAQKILKNLNQDNALVNLEVCDALYELNEFAKSKAELHNNARLFTGNKSKIFERRLGVVDDTINDACGPAMTEFLRENEAICQFVREKEKKDLKAAVDVRPLWKILKEQEKCDVLSIPEMDEELLSPLEVARRARAFDVFNQMFLDRSWVDVVFLRHIRRDPGLLLDQCKNSSEFLRTTTNKKYSEVKTFLKMLEARSPMFYVRHKKFTNPQLMEKFRQDYLYRVQYQTRRNMNSVLRSIKFLRKTNNVAITLFRNWRPMLKKLWVIMWSRKRIGLCHGSLSSLMRYTIRWPWPIWINYGFQKIFDFNKRTPCSPCFISPWTRVWMYQLLCLGIVKLIKVPIYLIRSWQSLGKQ